MCLMCYMCFMCLICPWTHRWPAGPCFFLRSVSIIINAIWFNQLYTTVATYVLDMTFFRDHFMSDPTLQKIFSSNDRNSIFYNIPLILDAVNRLYEELKKSFHHDIFMGGFIEIITRFLNDGEFTQPFLHYCRDIPLQKRTFSEAMRYHKFSQCVADLEASAKELGKDLEIQTYLKMPLQHLVRYHLILNGAMNLVHTAPGRADIHAIQAADHLAIKFAERANANQAMTERTETLVRLFKRLVKKTVITIVMHDKGKSK